RSAGRGGVGGFRKGAHRACVLSLVLHPRSIAGSVTAAPLLPRSPTPRRLEPAHAARPATPEGRRRRDAGAAERTRGEERSKDAPTSARGESMPSAQSNSDARGGV